MAKHERGLNEVDALILCIGDGQLYMRVFGSPHLGGSEWGDCEIENVYAEHKASSQTMSFGRSIGRITNLPL